jgi:hypothetical protein
MSRYNCKNTGSRSVSETVDVELVDGQFRYSEPVGLFGPGPAPLASKKFLSYPKSLQANKTKDDGSIILFILEIP